MGTVKTILKNFLSSRKNQALIAGAIVWLLALVGLDISPDRVTQMIGLIAAYILGVGLSDFGKEAEKVRTAAVKELAPLGKNLETKLPLQAISNHLDM